MCAYLRSKVESEITASSQLVFDQEGNLVGEAEFDGFRETSSLAEVDEVLEGESQGDRLGELDFDIQIWLLDVVVRSQSNSTVTNITSTGELDTILGGLDGNCRAAFVSMQW